MNTQIGRIRQGYEEVIGCGMFRGWNKKPKKRQSTEILFKE